VEGLYAIVRRVKALLDHGLVYGKTTSDELEMLIVQER
jgi:hypothetical protein